MFNVAELILK